MTDAHPKASRVCRLTWQGVGTCACGTRVPLPKLLHPYLAACVIPCVQIGWKWLVYDAAVATPSHTTRTHHRGSADWASLRQQLRSGHTFPFPPRKRRHWRSSCVRRLTDQWLGRHSDGSG